MSIQRNLLKCLLMVMVPLLPACVLEDTGKIEEKEVEVEALFSLTLPRSTTRALTADDEYAVSGFDVIVFDHATQRTLYKAGTTENIVQNNGNVRFTVKLRNVDGVSRYDFMILANTSELYPSDINPGLTKEEVQAYLRDYVAAGTGWVVNKASASYRNMPMWGELTNQTIEVKQYDETALTRMTVKVDISVEIANSDTFLMQEVWLCNYNTTGYIVPESGKWNSVTKYVDAPSVANLNVTTGSANGINYTSHISADKKSLKNTIYTFEAAQGSSANYTRNICILIKGTWTPSGGTAQTGWYRMDFANMDLQNFNITYLPLNRNHIYDMKIVDISGLGYDDKDEAYKSMPVNIINTVQGWRDGQLNNIYSDGQYMLGLSQLSYTLTRELRDNTDADNWLTITTDHVNGWKAVVYADEAGTSTAGTGWLTLSQGNGNANYPNGQEIWIGVTDNNAVGATARTAYIHVAAGRMTAKVKVTQTVDAYNYFLTLDGFENGTRGANRIQALVKSNAPWILLSVEDVDGVLQSYSHTIGTGGDGNRNGELFWYQFKDSAKTGQVKFTFQISPKGITQQSIATPKVVIAGWFARSNVVMKNSKFTFAVTESDNVLIPASVQGLFFRFGSMVGLGGVRGSGALTYNSDVVRIWAYGTNTYTGLWTSSSTGIPYDNTSTAASDYFNGYGTDGLGYYALTTGATSTNRNKGDICRWISDQSGWTHGKWRMPTEDELRLLYNQTMVDFGDLAKKTSGSFTSIGLPVNQPANEGRYEIDHGWWFGVGLNKINAAQAGPRTSPPVGTIFFPASGYRSTGAGLLADVGTLGYAWSATSATGTSAYNIFFTGTTVYTNNGFQRGDAMPIRCIRAE